MKKETTKTRLEGEQQYVSYCGRQYCALCDYHRGVGVKAARDLLSSYVEAHGSLPLIAEGQIDFEKFKEGLRWLASQEEPCKGCRFGGGWSWNPNCAIRLCCTEKNLDFCYQCEEFPCSILQEEPFLEGKKRTIEANKQIRKEGLASWAQALKKKYEL
ncbi:MAG: DUF3795 domain-containing protein [Candidatus Korarchaeota archaeon]|nr:DUF3795 domain-containing protein [Candidatus Korarchaeota archaeon]NIU84969.1 DUF3795 domain-containing protein [Candidatus Thorarchaeota archaeon]NIW14992.1 DUF3795 domain-containing protein [Candidatus Thorarchaeota archaeon]NIW53002.1 DUF3795 domain-containing protein [Candidatus Korarchaeota archaeon]